MRMSNPAILLIESQVCSTVRKKDIHDVDFYSTLVDPALDELTRTLQEELKLQKINNKEYVTVRYSLQVHIQKCDINQDGNKG